MQKTLKDISKELGVSTATISRALNKKTSELVKKETRDKILEYVNRTGFKPNLTASALAKGKLTNLLLILSQKEDAIFFDQYYMELIRGIHEILSDTEYSLGLLSIESHYTREQVSDILFRKETAALILSPHSRADELYTPELLKKYNFPIVSIDNDIDIENTYTVMFDHRTSGSKAAEYLHGKNYKKFVVISDLDYSEKSEKCKEGFFDYFRSIKCNMDNLRELEYTSSHLSGLKALQEIKNINEFPVGVFVMNDKIAAGIINHLSELGLRCPEDIGILTIDGLTIGQYVYPRLRSISFPIREVGRKVASILIGILEGKKLRKRKIIIDAAITEGESC